MERILKIPKHGLVFGDQKFRRTIRRFPVDMGVYLCAWEKCDQAVKTYDDP